MPKTHLRIATRKSPLALWQANHIREQLLHLWGSLTIELIPMVTSGDKFFKEKLSLSGGKGLFVKELEEALLNDQADLAVHSMKDVPAVFPNGLSLHAICERHNPLDAFVSCNDAPLNNLLPGSIIGTTSLRRHSQLLAAYPYLEIKPLRGNLQTRLAKLEKGEYDAIILAAAGLERMGLHAYIKEVIDPTIMLPACGQGALGIECRTNDKDVRDYIAPLNHTPSALCVETERHVNRLLGGNCHVPIAVYCQLIQTSELVIQAKVASIDGKKVIYISKQGHPNDASSLAEACVEYLFANGARDLL
jgi:hydroxymethylbilane synthase